MKDVNGNEIRVGDRLENVMTRERLTVERFEQFTDGSWCAWGAGALGGAGHTETYWRIVSRAPDDELGEQIELRTRSAPPAEERTLSANLVVNGMPTLVEAPSSLYEHPEFPVSQKLAGERTKEPPPTLAEFTRRVEQYTAGELPPGHRWVTDAISGDRWVCWLLDERGRQVDEIVIPSAGYEAKYIRGDWLRGVAASSVKKALQAYGARGVQRQKERRR